MRALETPPSDPDDQGSEGEDGGEAQRTSHPRWPLLGVWCADIAFWVFLVLGVRACFA